MSNLKKLLDRIEELEDSEADRYDDMPESTIIRFGDEAVLINKGTNHIWFPYSQLRKAGRDVFASNWILEKKGLA